MYYLLIKKIPVKMHPVIFPSFIQLSCYLYIPRIYIYFLYPADVSSAGINLNMLPIYQLYCFRDHLCFYFFFFLICTYIDTIYIDFRVIVNVPSDRQIFVTRTIVIFRSFCYTPTIQLQLQ